ncbi:hypothetical protein ACNS7O_17455 (plasmid) [Haloferacaceae archaeon DSL9]
MVLESVSTENETARGALGTLTDRDARENIDGGHTGRTAHNTAESERPGGRAR